MVDMSKFKGIYLSEAEDHIQKLNDNLLALEKKPGEKPILDELMRSSHTLKGSSAAMGYTKTAFLTHVMEDVFDYARNDQLKITPEIIAILFQTIDALEKTIDSINKNNKETDVEEQANILKKIAGVVTEGVGKSLRDASGKPVVDNSIQIDKKVSEAKLENKVKNQSSVDDKNIKSEEDQSSSSDKIGYIKVPVERLDRLMDLLEELIIDKMKLNEEVKTTPSLAPIADHLSRLVSDLQYQIMQVRLVPIEQIFMRFPRLVRDTATQMGKRVDFQVIGGDIELDRTIIDKLAEPLIHLLKNAVDHGIEKDGIVKLTASREKEFAVITVEDNGLGIDFEKVRQAAVKRGIVSSDEAKNMDKNSLTELLYHSKLSTSEKITETSGRGIGLGIVKNFASENGGRLTVKTDTNGGGTSFKLELPSAMSIISSLLVEVNKRLFVVPFSSIERSVRIEADNIKSMADQDVAVVDGNNVPLVYLSKLFAEVIEDLEPSVKETEMFDAKPVLEAKKSVLAVLINRGEERVGLVVDGLRDKLEIIVKPLPLVLRKTKGFSGSTILGDGSTILIIDAISLLEDTSKLTRT